MDLRKLKTLIDLVSESGISELEVTEGEGKVRIGFIGILPTRAARPANRFREPGIKAYACAPRISTGAGHRGSRCPTRG